MTASKPESWSGSGTRRVGYVIAALLNAGFLYVVQHLVEWDLFPWLTVEFEEVAPIISLSLLVSILVNVAYVFYDAAWFKALTQIVALAIALAATIQVYRVFPFDFSAYQFNWEAVARAVLILAMVGIVIGMIAEGMKLVRAVASD